MKDITRLLSRETVPKDKRKEQLRRSKAIKARELGRKISKHLFLSLTRRSNALAWLEIRSYLLIEGKLLFGGQELPLLFLMALTMFLAVFTAWRAYFIQDRGLPYESILWNCAVVLLLICLVSLLRIIQTAYAFETLQAEQMRLLGEQKLWMRCNASRQIGHEHRDLRKAFGLDVYSRKNTVDRNTSLNLHSFSSGSSFNDDMQLAYTDGSTGQLVQAGNIGSANPAEIALTPLTQDVDGKNEVVIDAGTDDENDNDGGNKLSPIADDAEYDRKVSVNSLRSASGLSSNDEVKRNENEDEHDENSPFLAGKDEELEESTKDDVLKRVDTAQWYTYNFGFLDDAMFLVEQKDIFPRLFEVKLNSVLAKAVMTVFISTVFTFFRLIFG